VSDKKITLTLSEHEATALAAIMGRVGGSYRSSRKHTETIYRALSEVTDRDKVAEYGSRIKNGVVFGDGDDDA
jgi:hypothetical protein